MNSATGERDLGKGRWFSGNNFWFRSRVLTDGRRFPDCWLTEPKFQLGLLEAGYDGIIASDAVVGHRIQPELLSLDIIQERGLRFGRATAEARLCPYRSSVNQARQFMNHPVVARCFCAWRLLKWSMLRLVARFSRIPGWRTSCELQADMEISYYRELLKIASNMPEYGYFALFRKHRDGR